MALLSNPDFLFSFFFFKLARKRISMDFDGDSVS